MHETHFETYTRWKVVYNKKTKQKVFGISMGNFELGVHRVFYSNKVWTDLNNFVLAKKVKTLKV